jgi:hypothetical protein
MEVERKFLSVAVPSVKAVNSINAATNETQSHKHGKDVEFHSYEERNSEKYWSGIIQCTCEVGTAVLTPLDFKLKCRRKGGSLTALRTSNVSRELAFNISGNVKIESP